MSDVTGGLRSRFLHDSLAALVETGLRGLGWFDENRFHLPLRIEHGPHTWSEPVTQNLLVFTTQDREGEEIELGSDLLRDTILISIDLYAQNESFGTDVANEIRDLLRGRLPGGAAYGAFPILDFRQPTPSSIGLATVAAVNVRRVATQEPEMWARRTFSIEVHLEDTYY